MRRVILDTNVLVSGVLTGDPEAPTCRIVDAVVDGRQAPLQSPPASISTVSPRAALRLLDDE